MNITQLTVSFKRTQSLPGYCNVSSSISMTADLSDDDNPSIVELDLRSEAEQAVNDWIDAELELAGQPARYSADPRYDLLWWRSANLGVIVPTGWQRADLKTLPGSWSFYCSGEDAIYTKQRLPNLRRMARDLDQYCPEFETVVKLHGWAHYYLSTPNLWCVVKTYAIGESDDEEKYLGRIGIPGEVYSELNADPALRLGLDTGYKSAGVSSPDRVGVNVTLIETVDDAYLWINSRLQELDQRDDEENGVDF